MKRLSEFFYRISKGWVALLALAIFIVFSALTLPGQNRISETYSQGSGSPDTSLFYSGGDLFAMAKWYGPAGRAAYIHARWTFDLAFPLVYTFFLVTSLSWFLGRVFRNNSKWRLLNLVPLAAMLLDLLENSMTTLVMAAFPQRVRIAEIAASFFTPFKWLAVGASFLLVLLGAILVISKYLQKTKSSTEN